MSKLSIPLSRSQLVRMLKGGSSGGADESPSTSYVIRSCSLPERSPLTLGEALLARPINTALQGSGKWWVPGTAYITSFRLLWEAAPDADEASAPSFARVVELPLHAIESCSKAGKSEEVAASPSTGITAEVFVKYAAFPALRLQLSHTDFVQLSSALQGSTLAPPTRPADLRASVPRTLAFARGVRGADAADTPADDVVDALHLADGAAGPRMAPAAAPSVSESDAAEGLLTGVPGWLQAEVVRLGVDQPSSKWRISRRNATFELCASYPAFLIVPAALSDDEIARASEFRSGRRLPVLCWKVRQFAFVGQ